MPQDTISLALYGYLDWYYSFLALFDSCDVCSSRQDNIFVWTTITICDTKKRFSKIASSAKFHFENFPMLQAYENLKLDFLIQHQHILVHQVLSIKQTVKASLSIHISDQTCKTFPLFKIDKGLNPFYSVSLSRVKLCAMISLVKI